MKKVIISAIIILVSISPLFRGLYFSYDSYAFLAGLALLSALYFIMKIQKSEPLKLNKALIICGIVLVCAAVLSFIKALNPRENLDTVLLYVELAAIGMVLYDFFHDNKQAFIKWLMIPVFSAGFVCSAVGLTALSGFAVWEVTTLNNRVGSTFQYANTAAVYFAICLLFAVTLIDIIDNILLKALFSGMGGVIVFALFMTGSRGGYLVGTAAVILLLLLQPHGHRIRGCLGFICMLGPVAIVMKGFTSNAGSGNLPGTILWLAVLFLTAAAASVLINLIFRLINKDKGYTSPKGTGYVFAAASVVLAGLAAIFRDRLAQLVPLSFSSRIASLIKLGFYEKNVLFRIEYDKDALKLIPANWLYGMGGGGWKASYQSVQDFFYTAAFVHNNYFQVLLESGILGFLAFTALVLISLWNSLRLYAKASDPRLRSCCAGLLCAMLALTVHSAADFDLSFVSLLLLLWTMFAAAAVNIPAGKGIAAAANMPLGGEGVAAGNMPSGDGITAPANKTGGIAAAAKKTGGIRADIKAGKYPAAAMAIICSALLSLNALHFTAAYNAEAAFGYSQQKDYAAAAVYYEEAARLDPDNTKYSFELAKLYRYFANTSKDKGTVNSWLQKARAAAEKSTTGNRHYPVYLNTLVRVYLDLNMPLEALERSQELIANQKYNAGNYELLARSCLAAADYYAAGGNEKRAEELLEKCAGIAEDPYLKRSVVDMPNEVDSKEVLSEYKPSGNLTEFVKLAEGRLSDIRSQN